MVNAKTKRVLKQFTPKRAKIAGIGGVPLELPNVNKGKAPESKRDLANKEYVDDEILAIPVISDYWKTTTDQTGLTGDKSGSFDLAMTTGSILSLNNLSMGGNLGIIGNITLGGTITTSNTGTFATLNATDEDDILQVDGSCLMKTGATVNNNIFLGEGAFDNDDGVNNVGIGKNAGFWNETTGDAKFGDSNVYIGYQAGEGKVSPASTGYWNIAIGEDALRQVQSGFRNVAIGKSCMTNISSGSQNFGMGADCLVGNSTGGNNLAIGYRAMQNVSNPDASVCLGNFAGRGVSDNNYNRNVCIGYFAGSALTTGSDNIFIGYEAGINQTTNGDLLIIDNQDRGSAAAEATECLIYGVFDNDPLLQEVKVNGEINCYEKSKMTIIGGFAIKLTNTTGTTSVIGQTVKANVAIDDAVVLTAADDSECIGVFYDAVADNAEAWVVVAGIADVAMEDNTAASRGNWVQTSETEGGYADATDTSPQAAPQHFNEIGHCIEEVAAEGEGTHILARCVLHFN